MLWPFELILSRHISCTHKAANDTEHESYKVRALGLVPYALSLVHLADRLMCNILRLLAARNCTATRFGRPFLSHKSMLPSPRELPCEKKILHRGKFRSLVSIYPMEAERAEQSGPIHLLIL